MTEILEMYKCNVCGNLVEVVLNGEGELVCCGQPMEHLKEKTHTEEMMDEKHVPVIEHQSEHVIVKVGSVEHPMLPAHFIEWIVLETATGYQKKELNPGEKPEADFAVTEPVIAAYEYCNLRGIWAVKA